MIRFNKEGEFDSETTDKLLKAKLKDMPKAVIPGFYGAYEDGKIKTFSRGGSDVTGSIVLIYYFWLHFHAGKCQLMQGIFQKENTDKALKYGIYRHLPTYEKIIRNLVSF